MPDPSTGIIAGGSILGGGLSYAGARGAAKDAAKAEAASLAFDKEQYNDWKALYGDLEKTLSDYYMGLDPDTYAIKGVEAFQKEQEQTLQRVRENFTQRGIAPDSGLAASTELAMQMSGATERARIRTEAPQAVAEAQQNFLAIGMGNNPASQVSNNLAGIADNRRTAANQAAQAAGTAVGTAISETTTALADYYRG